MESGTTETKRDRVRRLLITPLTEGGMRKSPSMKQDAYEALLVRLADKLSYLSDRHMAGLRERIIRNARGKERNRWPDEVSIIAWARQVQLPPPRKCPFVVSVLRSRAGVRARQLGYHAELLIAMRKSGPPFSKYDQNRMPEEARRNAAEAERVESLIRQGKAPVERQQWLDWYRNHQAEALAIMDAAEEEFEAVA